MTNQGTEGAYTSWTDSLVAATIRSAGRREHLRDIWVKLQPALSHATWPGWVDHSQAHVLSVLEYLDRLMPPTLLDKLKEIEAFVLVAATLLHDVGMIPEPEWNPAGLDAGYAELRKVHGARAAEIIRAHFADFFPGRHGELEAVCEIAKNHHGTFAPQARAGALADLGALALWLRLADELDFGPTRAPSWLLDYVRPNQEGIEHWRAHNRIQGPDVDQELFRILVTGEVEGEGFIRKLRSEFEAPDRQALQTSFLRRAEAGQQRHSAFIIWDKTNKTPPRNGRASKPRPALYSDEEYFQAGSCLYRLGHFKLARECFEDGVGRLGTWAEPPAKTYIYHYLKSLITLGECRRALDLADCYLQPELGMEAQADLRVASGLAHWKLGELPEASACFSLAADDYQSLAPADAAQVINEADAHVLLAAVHLEMMHRNPEAGHGVMSVALERALENADALFRQYEKQPGAAESHYRGRYWGVKAFYELLEIERAGRGEPTAWAKALGYAERAYGGPAGANRTPFGVMCGKYCAAAVHFHLFEHCTAKAEASRALAEAADLIADVRRTYDDLLGAGERVPGIWPQLHRLFSQILDALPPDQRGRLQGFSGVGGPVEPVDIYTPIR